MTRDVASRPPVVRRIARVMRGILFQAGGAGEAGGGGKSGASRARQVGQVGRVGQVRAGQVGQVGSERRPDLPRSYLAHLPHLPDPPYEAEPSRVAVQSIVPILPVSVPSNVPSSLSLPTMVNPAATDEPSAGVLSESACSTNVPSTATFSLAPPWSAGTKSVPDTAV